jgi:hypothetical protein
MIDHISIEEDHAAGSIAAVQLRPCVAADPTWMAVTTRRRRTTVYGAASGRIERGGP